MISRTIVFLLILSTLAGHAQVGNLDNNFSGDGKLMTPIGNGNDMAYGVAVQGDNRIVAVGSTRQGGNNDFAIVRYMEDGSLDLSFSGDGIVEIDFDGGDDEARDVVLTFGPWVPTPAPPPLPGYRSPVPWCWWRCCQVDWLVWPVP